MSCICLCVCLCVCLCICIFLDPACRTSYSELFCHLLFKNISHHRCLRFYLYLSLLLLGATGSANCSTGWYLVVLGQNRAVLVASVICFQKIFGLHGVNHQIIQYSEKEKVMTDRHTDKWTNGQTEF